MNHFDLPMNATAELTLRELEPADFSRWDEFVQACPQATFFHRAGWKTIGQKIAGGELAGDYGSNEEPDVTTWYTRGAPRACDPQPEFYFLADDLIDPVVTFTSSPESYMKYVDQHPELSIKMGVTF